MRVSCTGPQNETFEYAARNDLTGAYLKVEEKGTPSKTFQGLFYILTD